MHQLPASCAENYGSRRRLPDKTADSPSAVKVGSYAEERYDVSLVQEQEMAECLVGPL